VPTSPLDPPISSRSLVRLGTSAPLSPDLTWELAAHGIAARTIAADTDPPSDIDIVLVLQPPSALIGRCRGRWPVIVVVDDPRATDVSRLLRAGVSDVIRQPIHAEDLASRVHRLLVPPAGEADDEDDD
jgi:DNA-binding response OmpR family regulator